VGKRNYRYFYMFLVSLALLCVFIFACAVTHLVLLGKDEDGGKSRRNFVEAIRKSPSSLVVIVICFFSIWSVIGLAGFHTYLTSANLTTNEDIKGSYSSKRGHANFNPFSSGGVLANCFAVLCSPLSPSLIDAGGVVTDQYLISNSMAAVKPSSAVGVAAGDGPLTSQFQQQYAVASASSAGRASYGALQEPRFQQQQLSPTQQQQQQQQKGGDYQIAMHQANGEQFEMQPHQQQQQQPQLSTRNVKLHNGVHYQRQEEQQQRCLPSDLDQTTMIGSALDLDSLNGDDSGSVPEGSQVGLIGRANGQGAASAGAV